MPAYSRMCLIKWNWEARRLVLGCFWHNEQLNIAVRDEIQGEGYIWHNSFCYETVTVSVTGVNIFPFSLVKTHMLIENPRRI
jgi:hypothetical protein